jgi:hypothetical protein
LVKEHAKETSLYLSMVRFERLISLLMVVARLSKAGCVGGVSEYLALCAKLS